MITLLLILSTLFNTVSSTSTPCSGTSYSVPFPYGATGTTPDLVVAAAGVTIPYSSGWTINKVSSTSTGTITLATACTGTLTITRTTPRTQPTGYRTQGKLDLAVLESNLDRIEMQMQESVVQGGGATLSSLTLTTPLPVASGGTGAAPPNCGAGVLTSNGTSFSCVTLSGLAPPGTTGVLLQTVTPGSVQTGHMNISGTLLLGGGGTFQSSISNGSNSGLKILGTGVTGVTTLSTWTTPFDLNNGAFIFRTDGAGKGQLQIAASTSASFPTIISTNSNPIIISSGGGTGTTQLIVDTAAITHASGKLFDIQNNTVSKASFDFTGVATVAGVTSSGPVSGTTGTFTGGATIGTSGTAISGSFRATGTLTPGSIVGGASASMSLTVTGAVAGADCKVTPPAGGMGVFTLSCWVTSNTCNIGIGNPTAGSLTGPAGTYACRVFNP